MLTTLDLSISVRRANYGIQDFRGDILGGVTAGVVSLPIVMGYGILSGLGPAAGSMARLRPR